MGFTQHRSALSADDQWAFGRDLNLALPYRNVTQPISELLTRSIYEDALSGEPSLDHTAALLAAFSDANAKKCVTFPAAVWNVGRVRLPLGMTPKEVILGQSTFKLRTDIDTGGGFFRLTMPTGATGSYGAWDDFRVEGGTFDVDGHYFGAGPIAQLCYMRRTTLRDITIRHRTVAFTPATLDYSTDVFTAAGHGFANGAALVLISGTNSTPGGHPGSGTRFYVVNRTSDTFQLSLTVGGSAVNFTSNGAALLVQPYVSWATAIGGQDLTLENLRVLNGTGIYQDGIHLIHGRNIQVIGGHVESGDDALALGYEIDGYIADNELRDVYVTGLQVKSTLASAVKVYAPAGSGRSVVGAEIEVCGQSGMYRNGGVAFDNFDATPLTTGDAPIRDVRVRANLTLGAADRTQTLQPYIAAFRGCMNCHVDGQFRILGDVPFVDVQAERAINCSLTGEVTEQSARANNSIAISTTRNIQAAIKRPQNRTNLIANPSGYGLAEGQSGSGGTVPTGWRGTTPNNGLSVYYQRGALIDGKRMIGYRIVGTTTAVSTGILCPIVNSSIPFVPATPKYTFEWSVQLEGGNLPSGTTMQFAVLGLSSDGNTTVEGQDIGIASLVTKDGSQAFSAEWTMVNAATAYVRGQLAYSIPSGQAVDFMVWTYVPELFAE